MADKADIGTGTLFLYTKTKSGLLLLVQNSSYAKAIKHGAAAAERATDVLDAVIAIVRSDCGMQPHPDRQRADIPEGSTFRRP